MFFQHQEESLQYIVIMVGKYVKQQLNTKREAVDVEGCFTFFLDAHFSLHFMLQYNMVCAI